MLYTASKPMNKLLYVVNWFRLLQARRSLNLVEPLQNSHSLRRLAHGPRRCAEWAVMLLKDTGCRWSVAIMID